MWHGVWVSKSASGRVRAFLLRLSWPVYLVPLAIAATIFVLVNPRFGLSPTTGTADRSSDSGHLDIVGSQDAAECATNRDPQLILVSIAQQHAWMCAGHHMAFDTPVTTGDVHTGDGTPTGTWHIESKETDRYLEGPGYSDFVHYWMPFFGDFGLHDATWQTMPFGDPKYRSQGSHGCVHLPSPAMSSLYDWAQVGTTVTVKT